MNLSINAASMYGRKPVIYNRQSYNNNTSFHGHAANSTIRKIGYSVAGLTFITLLSCLNSKLKNQDSDVVKTDSIEMNDTSIVSSETNDKGVKTDYHYLPTDGGATSDNYTWVEKKYPDGRVEKDSLGYKITETPDGERTVSTIEKNANGEKVITTDYSDGSKGIRIENGINYKDTIYWANGNIKQIKNKEVVIEHGKSKSPYDKNERIVNQTYKAYDENGILLFWELVDNNEKIDENNFKYDKHGRLIDNGFTKYEYEGDSETPFRITDELEGCKYITEMDEDGVEIDRYFKASNGVITPAAKIYSISW